MLGKTGFKVSEISMGCWGIGGQWGPVEEKEAISTIHAAYDAGVNLFDTADAYGLGQSEFYPGKALRGIREDVFIATKVGNWARRFGDAPGLKTIHSIINCCHASLYRLGTDYIDLYQCHVNVPDIPELFVEAFEVLKKQGKIRHYAISTNDNISLKALDSNGECSACQINYSLLNRTAEKDILPFCLEKQLGVLIRGPLAQGMLSDKFSDNTHFDDCVRQKWNPGSSHNQEFLNNLEKIISLKLNKTSIFYNENGKSRWVVREIISPHLKTSHFHEGLGTEFLERMADKVAISINNILLIAQLKDQLVH